MDALKTKQLSENVFDYVVAFRRDLHMHPEPSLQEFETTKKVAAELDQMGISYRLMNPTGLIAEIKGEKPGTGCVAIRGDMDCLTIQEKTNVPFKSTVDGLMHACGHDSHTAMLLGAAKVLQGLKSEFAGTVRFLFQPAEEVAQGAKLFVQQGALEGVDYCFGQHVMAQYPAGQIFGAAGPTHAECDKFTIKIKGHTCHGAMPEQGIDATVCAAAMIMNLQTLVSREFNPMDPLVVTVGQVHSGSRFNIVSGEAWMDGTVRCFNRDIAHAIPGVMERVVKETAATFRCTAELVYEQFTDVLFNDDDAMAIGKTAAEKVAPDHVMHKLSPINGSEDFAEYTAHAKSGFFMLGCGGDYPQHSDYFYIDEESFKTGVALYVQVALDTLDLLQK